MGKEYLGCYKSFDPMYNNYQSLGLAVAKQAFNDYVDGAKRFLKGIGRFEDEKMMIESVLFFESGHFFTITGCTDNQFILDQLKKVYNYEEKIKYFRERI